MDIGKIKKSTLERSVLRPLYGQNFTGRMCGPRVCTVHGWTLAAERLVYGTLNEAAATGISEARIALQVTIPENVKEPQLKKLMQDIAVLCDQENSGISSVQVTVSDAVNTLMLSGAVCGKRLLQKMKIQKQDYDIVAVGTVGREGAALLTFLRKEELLTRYTENFLKKAEMLYDEACFYRVGEILRQENIAYMCPVREGGFFASLWELSEYMKSGFDISLRVVPIAQHTIEVCEFFNLNPYQLLGGGMLLLACESGEEIVRTLHEQGITASVIGSTKEQKEKIVRYDDEVRNLEPPKKDEIYKVLR